MISMDADKALRSTPGPDDGHLYLLRDGQNSQASPANYTSNGVTSNGVGSIQSIRPLNATTSDVTGAASYDDGLLAARGMLVGIVLGIGFWSLIAGLIGVFVF